jgi:hypothetical protein
MRLLANVANRPIGLVGFPELTRRSESSGRRLVTKAQPVPAAAQDACHRSRPPSGTTGR